MSTTQENGHESESAVAVPPGTTISGPLRVVDPATGATLLEVGLDGGMPSLILRDREGRTCVEVGPAYAGSDAAFANAHPHGNQIHLRLFRPGADAPGLEAGIDCETGTGYTMIYNPDARLVLVLGVTGDGGGDVAVLSPGANGSGPEQYLGRFNVVGERAQLTLATRAHPHVGLTLAPEAA